MRAKDKKITVAIILLFFIMAVTIGAFSYAYYEAKEESWKSLNESAYLSEARMGAIIETYYGALENLSKLMVHGERNQSTVNIVRNMKLNAIESPIRYYAPDGYAITENGVLVNASDYVNYFEIDSNERYTSVMHEDPFNPGVQIVEHFVPVYADGKVKGMLCAVMDVSKMQDFIIESSKRSQTSILIADLRTNAVIIDSERRTVSSLSTYNGGVADSEFSYEEWLSDIYNRIPSGIITKSSVTGHGEFMFAIPSREKEWCIIVKLAEDVAFSRVQLIRNIFTLLTLVETVSFVAYIIWLLYTTRKQLAAESREYTEIVKAFGRSYEYIFYVNLKDNTYIPFGPSKDRDDKTEGRVQSEFFERSVKYLVQNVYQDDFSKVSNFTNAEYIRETLKTSDNVSFEYRIAEEDKLFYRRMKIVKTGLDNNHVIMAIEDVDAEVRSEKKRQVELEEALSRANSASMAKTAFLNSMSHDIRTPMNIIMGFTNRALQYIDDKDKVRDSLIKAKNSSAHLLSLINDMLDMSRIESGRVELNEVPTDITKCSEGIITMLKDMAIDKKLNLSVSYNVIRNKYLYIDVLRLNQVIINLVSNAIKYTDEGGNVLLNIIEQDNTENEEFSTWQIIVEDSGIGMSPEFVENAFDAFSRERTSTISKHQGTGLGLAITKSIVEMMRGGIAVESEPGKGSKFTATVELRVCHESYETEQLTGSEDEANDVFFGKRILLVEDNELNRELVKELLEELNFFVDEAEDGQVALNLIETNGIAYYDLILMDIQMPVMDGYEATGKIRENYPDTHIPIIALSANAFDEDRKMSYQAGMDAHQTKPVVPADLIRTMKKLLYHT